jgi:hypothetical protein
MRRVLFILGFLAGLPLAGRAGADLQARFEKSAQGAHSLSRVQMNWLDTLWIADPAALKFMNATKFSRTFEYSFIASGPKFRAGCKLVSGTQTNLIRWRVSAFDGTTYTTYTADSGYMTKRSTKQPAGNNESAHNPLTAPFMFLTKESDDCINCVLRSTDIAADGFARGFTLPTAEKAEGVLEISLPGLPRGKQPTAWKITLEEVGDAFSPKSIRFVAPGSRYEVVSRLLNYTNLGAYAFPTRIEWSSSSFPPTSPSTLLATGAVTVVSARIPDQVADSVFRLEDEEKAAVTLWDGDQQGLIKSGPESPACTEARPASYADSVEGSKQITQALDRASKEHKHVLLQFGADGSGASRRLEKLFNANKKIAQELETNYVVVKIDMNNKHNQELDAKYGQPTRLGLPALVILAADGKPVTPLDTGRVKDQSPEKVLSFLKAWSPTK